MWCPQCNSEVATKLAADGHSLLCANCQGGVRQLSAPSVHPDVQRARDILSRLSSAASSSSAIGPDEPVELDEVLEAAADIPPQAARPAPPRQFRIDRAHPTSEIAHTYVGGPSPAAPIHTDISRAAAHSRSDEAHAEIPAPHFHVQPARPQSTQGAAESTWGQLMAYAGAGVLTIGTALVVWGYLGGPATYAPTGWLVATGGQMLLVLGVVTLIAGGMQQTTHEVSSRVSHLNGRIIRIEQTANELLRGPHFGDAAQRESIRSERSDDATAGA